MANLSLNRRIDLIAATDIEQVRGLSNGQVAVTLRTGAAWTKLPTGLHRPIVSVKPSDSDAGRLYTADMTARLPLTLASDDLLRTMRRMHQVVARYQKTDGTWQLVGSPTFPLRLAIERIDSEEAASFSGYELRLTGKQTHGQLQIDKSYINNG